MARIPLDPPRTLTYRLAAWFTRRKYGTTLDPLRAMGHNMRVSTGYGLLEAQASRWKSVDRRVQDLAVMGAAVAIGCQWCVDFGYWESHTHGIPIKKIEAISHWRDSDLFTPFERLVLHYATAMTETPPTVTDEMVEALHGHLSEAQFVELTMLVALENLRSRFNSAVGLTGQGFKDRCEIPSRTGRTGTAEE
ncbi:carboxymuconolactone decarboxylase family protein [Actinomadura sp. HBU206391]|uniref:carboxymuconolactone decarboxylase family protein n=1 Tax=Actinomadura sp. HBU206391 TaxID=2731692 RepID=UPI00164FAA8B|nr:carboxymuconolactone decarboxylase family protein [Actinomadura sp. HBU206391]MBC6461748.1 carboxymuconolactone decarboxylase family protein [Actinomadura sp. HBU206391]